MSKMNEMAQTIEELRTAAAAISDIADWLTAQFGGVDDKQTVEKPAAEKPAPPKLTLERVRATLAEKSRAGHAAEIRALLQRYGATKLSQIDPANYEALLRDAEVLDDAT
ncbi:MAG: DNA ligase [Phascolarctobacterium sp.]|nr:DNA ligase [Phascolarctobacterium sp.]